MGILLSFPIVDAGKILQERQCGYDARDRNATRKQHGATIRRKDAVERIKRLNQNMKNLVPSQQGHVMLSYNWESQDKVKRIKEYLEKLEYNIWMDIDRMYGGLNKRMAEGVEGAEIVVAFMTEEYEQSKSCMKELNFSEDKKKKIIPVKLERNYERKGELGLIVAGKKYIDFSDESNFDANCDELKREIDTLYAENQAEKHFNKFLEDPFQCQVKSHGISPIEEVSLKSRGKGAGKLQRQTEFRYLMPKKQPSLSKIVQRKQQMQDQTEIHPLIPVERVSLGMNAERKPQLQDYQALLSEYEKEIQRMQEHQITQYQKRKQQVQALLTSTIKLNSAKERMPFELARRMKLDQYAGGGKSEEEKNVSEEESDGDYEDVSEDFADVGGAGIVYIDWSSREVEERNFSEEESDGDYVDAREAFTDVAELESSTLLGRAEKEITPGFRRFPVTVL